MGQQIKREIIKFHLWGWDGDSGVVHGWFVRAVFSSPARRDPRADRCGARSRGSGTIAWSRDLGGPRAWIPIPEIPRVPQPRSLAHSLRRMRSRPQDVIIINLLLVTKTRVPVPPRWGKIYNSWTTVQKASMVQIHWLPNWLGSLPIHKHIQLFRSISDLKAEGEDVGKYRIFGVDYYWYCCREQIKDEALHPRS